MFKVIRKFSSYISAIILAFVIAISIPVYLTAELITDRENVRTWLQTEGMRQSYKTYMLDLLIDEANLDIIGAVIDVQEVEDAILAEMDEDWLVASIDSIVDSTYDWLEGKADKPELSLVPDVDSINEDINDSLSDQLGLINSILSITNITVLDENIDVLNLNDKIVESVPTMYEQLTLLPRRLIIINGVLLAFMVFNARDPRHAFSLVGFTALASGLIMVYGPDYVKENPQALEVLNINVSDLPSIDELPIFIGELFEIVQVEVWKQAEKYAWYLIIGGGIVAGLSQISVSEVDVFDWTSSKKSKEDDLDLDETGEESEQEAEE